MQTSSLEQLDAQGCNVADHLMPFMGRALKVATSLVSLHLENTMMSGKSLATLGMYICDLNCKDKVKNLSFFHKYNNIY